VSKPGEQTYRPGKTARQAIAVSGGPDVVRYRASHPGVEVADAKAEYDNLSIEIVKRKLATWRLRKELGVSGQLDLSALGGGSVDAGAVAAMAELETNLFQSRAADFAKQRDGLALAAREVEEQLKIMTDQLEKEERGRQADADELAKVQELFSKGSLPSPRVTDARRAVLLSATRKLQIESQIAQYRRQKGDIASNLTRLDGLRTIEIQDKLTSENAALAAAESKIVSTISKIKYLGMLKASLSSPDEDMFKVTVHRGGQSQNVGQDFALAPGDVVEVTLRSALTTIGSNPVDTHTSRAPEADRNASAPKS
jgi:polysaccharide biosynthesis/export protein